MKEKDIEKWQKLLEADEKGINKVIHSGCQKCKNGKIRILKSFGWDVQICDCWLKADYLKRVYELWKQSDLPKSVIMQNPLKKSDYKNISFSSFVSVMESSNWAYIFGEVGTGKTFAAVLLSQMALLEEKSVYFTPVVKLMDDLRPDGKEEVREKVLTCDFLVLDDVGKEKISEWVKERLYLIINERYNNDLQTIFTSNEGVEKLKTTISEAVYSRINSKAAQFCLLGKDRRFSLL